jgi:predicted ABC-type ATPase
VQAPLAVRALPDFGGDVLVRPHAGGECRVASLERCLVDLLHAPQHGGGWEEIWRSFDMVGFLDLGRVVDLTLRMQSALTAARVGFFLEQHRQAWMVEETHLQALRQHAPAQPRYLDPRRESGTMVRRWNLVVPEHVLKRRWEKSAPMTLRRPLVVLMAGPNGAGKSTGAERFLRGALSVDEFVNADTIAQGLSAYRSQAAAVAAGRVMIERIRFLAKERRDFALETTLSGRGHARWLRELRLHGYRAHLIFLALPSADLAVARVAERVAQRGHDVPEPVVRRRFSAGLRNLFSCYADVVGSWEIYDNSSLTGPRVIAAKAPGESPAISDEDAWNRLQELTR